MTLLRNHLTRFVRDDSGTATVEFVLWVPIFVLILSLIVDVCFLFLAQTRLYDVASDATRQLAIGHLSVAEAQSYAMTNATFRGIPATASVAGGTCTAYCSMTVELNSGDVAVTGVLNFLASDKLSATVTQLKEGI